jgi:hypothetical protein
MSWFSPFVSGPVEMHQVPMVVREASRVVRSPVSSTGEHDRYDDSLTVERRKLNIGSQVENFDCQVLLE